MIEPEQYNELGEIVKPERKLDFYNQHRIHQTKDLFVGDCSLCQQDAKKWQQQKGSWWGDDE